MSMLLICSGVIALAGSVTNALSLSYFIRRVERTLCNQIFIMLNVFDLLVLLFDVIVVFFLFCGSNPICGRNTPYFKVTLFLFVVSIDSTAFATCLLIVTRTISICYPFYQINKKAVQIAALVFLIQEILRLFVKLYAYYINTSRSVLSFCTEFDNYLMLVLLSIVILPIFILFLKLHQRILR